MSKMDKELTYFHLNGLAESIRYILHAMGQKFKDVRYDFKSWPIKEKKDALPFGQLPLYQAGDRTLHQSIAIARYVAAGTPLLPSDPWEQAVLDAAVLTIYDFDKHVISYIQETDPEKREVFKKKLYSEVIDFYFSRFEKQLKENNGYLEKKLSWVDFVFVGIIECTNLFLHDEIEKGYPAITELIKNARNVPGVKEYIETRETYVGW